MTIHAGDFLHSVEGIFLLWLGALLLLAVLTRPALRRLTPRRWRILAAGEEGAAYSLSYVMVFPIYLLLVCLVVETSLILIVKMGTVYAAYAGARSAAVWDTARPEQSGTKVQLAAAQALVPFADSRSFDQLEISSGGANNAGAYIQAYRQYTENGKAPDRYLEAKYRYAQFATKTRLESTRGENGTVTVTVRYEMPLHVPGVGRILGQRASWQGRIRTYLIESKATLPNESSPTEPANPAWPLGIEYVSE